MRGIVNVTTYFDYSGTVRNKVVEFKNMSDISYLSSRIKFAEAEKVFIVACDRRFSQQHLTPENFPNVKEIWFNSYFDIQVLDRFKIPIYFSTQYAIETFPLSYKDKTSWLYTSINLVTEEQIKSELNQYKETKLLKD